MAGSRTLKLSILADVDDLKKKLNQSSTEVQTFGNKVTKFGKIAGAAFLAASAAAGAFAVKIGIDAVKAASDLSETVSKVGVLFGDTAKDIEKFADGAASSLGQTKQEALDAAATFATFGKAAGLSGEDLSKFSVDFVGLASDLASFNNTSPEQAINAIGSALRGEAEPLRAYGVLLNDASLRQAALELGIVSTTKNALTPQQKVLAAQALIYEQTGTAQGDFARTSDGLANKTRILTAQFENAKAEIGEKLLPIILDLVTIVQEKVIPNLGKFAELFKPITDAIVRNKETFQDFGKFLVDYVVPVLVVTLGGALKVVGKIAGGIIDIIGDVIKGITNAVQVAINAINKVIKAYNAIPILPNIPTIGGSTPAPKLPASGPDAARAGSVNITVNGAVDPAGTARQIAGLLKTEASTSGSFNTLGLSTFG
jgi:hypothetical protein